MFVNYLFKKMLILLKVNYFPFKRFDIYSSLISLIHDIIKEKFCHWKMLSKDGKTAFLLYTHTTYLYKFPENCEKV